MAKGKKTGGRRPGSLNKVTVEVKAACSSIVDNPAYRAGLESRAQAGRLHPAVETMLWYYAKGKPKELLDLNVINPAVANLSDVELHARAAALVALLSAPE